MPMTTTMPLAALRQVGKFYVRENVVPTVTPFIAGGRALQVDREGVARLCDNLQRLKVRTLFVNGTTGGFVHMTDVERILTVSTFALESRGRFKIIANATGDTPEATIRNVSTMSRLKGVDALVLAPLHYLQTNEQIRPHMDRVKEILTGERDLPLFLYNYAKLHRDKSLNIDPEVVSELADEEIIAGIKDSSGDLGLVERYAQVIETGTGDEGHIIEALRRGASFAVGSMGNILPYPQNIFFARTINGMMKWQDAINDVRGPLTANLRCPTAAIKYYLSLQGICSDRVAVEKDALTPPEKAEVERVYSSLS